MFPDYLATFAPEQAPEPNEQGLIEISRNEAAIERDLSRLEETRSARAAALERFRAALQALIGKVPELDFLRELLALAERSFRNEAWKMWPGLDDLNVETYDASALAAVFPTPDEVRAIVQAWEEAQVEAQRSDDVSAYWNKKKKAFEAPPITAEERTGITGRHTAYVRDPEDVPAVHIGRALARLYSHANQRGAKVEPAHLSESPGRALAYLFEWQQVETPRGWKTYSFRLNEEGLVLYPGRDYRAFDEPRSRVPRFSEWKNVSSYGHKREA